MQTCDSSSGRGQQLSSLYHKPTEKTGNRQYTITVLHIHTYIRRYICTYIPCTVPLVNPPKSAQQLCIMYILYVRTCAVMVIMCLHFLIMYIYVYVHIYCTYCIQYTLSYNVRIRIHCTYTVQYTLSYNLHLSIHCTYTVYTFL